MRDIRSDLQERATLTDEQIRATVAHFDRTIQQLQTERDTRIAELKSGLAMIAKFMEFEERFLPKPTRGSGFPLARTRGTFSAEAQ
jgi:hypothetical protein